MAQQTHTNPRSRTARPERTTASCPALIALAGDEAELFASHHSALQRVIARRVNLAPDLIEDACQQTWIKLMRHQPDRGPALFGWLVTVAIREAYRLSSKERRHISIETPSTDHPNRTRPVADRLVSPANIDHSLEARRALRALAALPPRQRRYASLQIAGASYTEIAAHQNVTYTNVNKHLDKARNQLCLAFEQAA